VQAYLANLDHAEAGAKLQSGQSLEWPSPDGPVLIEPTDVFVQSRAPEGWVGVADRGTQVAIDIRLTEALQQEGMARDVVRYVQELRKTGKLEMEDRIELYLGTESAELQAAIAAFQSYIASETLTIHWASDPLEGEGGQEKTVNVEGHALRIMLRKVK
jgi:isoleucyl-tRNA synthetase